MAGASRCPPRAAIMKKRRDRHLQKEIRELPCLEQSIGGWCVCVCAHAHASTHAHAHVCVWDRVTRYSSEGSCLSCLLLVKVGPM